MQDCCVGDGAVWGSKGPLPPYWQPCTNSWLITTQNSTISSVDWITLWGEEAQKGKFLVLWHKCPSGNSGSKGAVGSVSVRGRKPHTAVFLVLCHAIYLSQLTSGVLLLQQHQFNSCEWKVSSTDAIAQQHTSISFFPKETLQASARTYSWLLVCNLVSFKKLSCVLKKYSV